MEETKLLATHPRALCTPRRTSLCTCLNHGTDLLHGKASSAAPGDMAQPAHHQPQKVVGVVNR